MKRLESYMCDLEGMVVGGTVSPAWRPDGSAFGYVDGPADAREAWLVDVISGLKQPLLDAPRARTAIRDAIGETPAGQGVPFNRFSFATDSAIRFESRNRPVLLDLVTYSAIVEDTPAVERRTYARSMRFVAPQPALEVLSPDGAFLLSTEENNIAVRSTTDGRIIRLTDNGTPECGWRFDHPVDGLSGERCWSPDGQLIAAHMVDLRGVYRAPRVHYLKPRDEVEFIPFSRAGGVLEQVSLWVLDLLGRPPVELKIGATRDTYPVHAGWLPDSSALVTFQMSRDCKRVDIGLADARTGEVQHLFSEVGESFVRMQHNVFAQLREPSLDLWLTPEGDRIIWKSDRSGWAHLYTYDLRGVLLAHLTDGAWPVEEVIAVCDGWVYFTGRTDHARPYDVHYCRAPIDGGDVQILTDAPGVHSITAGPDGSVFLDRYSTPSSPPVVELRSSDGRRLIELSRADISKLEDFGYTPAEEFVVTAADDVTELWGVMFKPHDFDPRRSYPLIEYIYGGPSFAVAPHAFIDGVPFTSGAALAQGLAQLGYVTVVLDGRGTPGRSKAFHVASYRRWANVLAADHACALKQLSERFRFLDQERIGIIGHSWGAYSAFRCLAEQPDVYRAAVCAAPGLNPYKINLWECYLDVPQRNVDGYAFANPFPLAQAIDGDLMIAVGTSDVSTFTDAVKLSDALIKAGKDHEFVLLPDAGHVFGGANDVYFRRKVAEFFERHLGQPSLV